MRSQNYLWSNDVALEEQLPPRPIFDRLLRRSRVTGSSLGSRIVSRGAVRMALVWISLSVALVMLRVALDGSWRLLRR